MLRWFRQAAPLHVLAADAGLSLSTADRYLHEGISVLAEHAPDLHEVLERGRREDWSPISLDGTLIQTDRVSAPGASGHDPRYCGRHKQHGGNIQVGRSALVTGGARPRDRAAGGAPGTRLTPCRA